MVLNERARTTLATKERAKEGASAKREVDYTKPTDADQIRDMLQRADLSQRGAAGELDIDERTMRRYCSGELPVPKVIFLAMKQLIVERRSTKDE